MAGFSEGAVASADLEFAPLCIPVEIRRIERARPSGLRLFRLATGICLSGLRLRTALPEELRRMPLSLRLRLPPPVPFAQDLPLSPGEEWQGALSLSAVAKEVVVRDAQGERAELRQLAFLRLTPPNLARIEQYVTLRLLSPE